MRKNPCSAEQEFFLDLQDFNRILQNVFWGLTKGTLSFSAAERRNVYNKYRSEKLILHNM